MKSMLFAFAIAFAGAAAAQSMEPGEWQFSSTMTSKMLPKPQTSVVTRCITKEDAQDPTNLSGKAKEQGCTVTPGNRTPSSYNWTIACPKQGMSGEGKVRFTRDSVDSELQMNVELQGQKMQLTTLTTGRLLGPCKPK